MSLTADAPLGNDLGAADAAASSRGTWHGGSPSGSTSFLKSLSHVRSLPAVSMHARVVDPPPPEVPAPGTYHLPNAEQLSKHRTGPRFGFGRRSPLPGASRAAAIPGPGAHDPRDVLKAPRGGLGHSFGSAPARGCPSPVRQYAPGPGAYHPAEAAGGAAGRGAPGFKIQGRPREEKPRSRSLPGPGAYNTPAASNFRHEGTTKYSASTMVGFGTSRREDLHAKHVTAGPGPGAYDPESGGDSAAKGFSMAARRLTHDQDGCLMPGPGEYGAGGTSFGYRSSFALRPARSPKAASGQLERTLPAGGRAGSNRASPPERLRGTPPGQGQGTPSGAEGRTLRLEAQ
mmetsp:Transcript_29738/g.85144  ORF Transcript_29738/g.85144 Transcript_29738/m.85144 type:complete len:344 (+) Transcript_29738:92-1123(+)